MMDLLKKPVIIVSFVVWVFDLVLLYKKNMKIPMLMFIFAFYFILQSLMFVMAGTSYLHYYITAVPFILYPLAELFCIISSDKKTKSILFAVIIMLGSSILLVQPVLNIYDYFTDKMRDSEVIEMIEIVDRESSAEDEIIVFGNWDYGYLATDRKSATRYTYAKPVIYLDHSIYDDYFLSLERNVPRIIIVEFLNDDMRSFLKKHSYYIIYESPYLVAFKTNEIQNDGGVL